MARKNAETERVKKVLRERVAKWEPPRWLSSGATVLDLTLTSRVGRAYGAGVYYLFVGDSASGKTWAALAALAEAANNPEFKDYRLIYDAAAESGAKMDMVKFFGQKLAERVEFVTSLTVEEFYYALDDLQRAKVPFIYVMDSESSLTCDQDDKKFQEQKLAYRKKQNKAAADGNGEDKDLKGSMGMAKAKYHSGNLRRVVGRLPQTGSILFLIAQTRQKAKTFGFGEDKTRAGGLAMTFYTDNELWFSTKGELKVRVAGEDRVVGSVFQIRPKKNRNTGYRQPILVRHLVSSGVDDVGTCVDYLVKEKHWEGDLTVGPRAPLVNKGRVKAPEFKFEGTKEALIRQIEDNNQEKELRLLVAQRWAEIEEEMTMTRKPRYQ